MRWDTSAVWWQNHWLLIRDDLTGLWLDCLQISFSPSSERTHITWNVWLDWAGTGATSHACTGWPGITPETAPTPVLPCASLPASKRGLLVCHKVQEKVPVPWGWRRKQLQRNKLLILMFQEKEKRKDTGTQKEGLRLALMCSFPQDGSSPEHTE